MRMAFFEADGDVLTPLDLSRSSWSRDQMHGLALAGALARGIEQKIDAMGRTDLRPSRVTVDLFRPGAMAPCTVETEVVREGRRIVLLEATMFQDGERTARASAIFLLPSESPDGLVWQPSERPSPPPEDVVPVSNEPRIPFLHSEIGWSQDFTAHQNASQKTIWQVGLAVVEGEEPTPFQIAASMADSVNMVSNWGDRGVQFINTDITLGLSRLPTTKEIGIRAVERTESDGIAIAVAEMFDRDGLLGQVMTTAIANARRTVDFTEDPAY